MKFIWLSLLAATLVVSPSLAQDLTSTNRQMVVNNDGTISLQGVLDPIETLRLATRDAGIVSEVLVSEGSVVKSGDPIAVLDSDIFAAEVDAAKNALAIAQQETKNDVDLQYAKILTDVNQQVLNRSRIASEQFPKSVSATELERLRLEYERSRLSGLQAERQQEINRLSESLKRDQLSIAQLNLKNRTIVSRIDGTVVQVFHTPGEFVNSGEPIARILNLNRLRVICSGDAKVVDPDELSQDAVFHVKHGKTGETTEYPAKLTFISPELDPVRQTFPIWAEIQNEGNRLKSGTVGRLEIQRK